MFDFKKLFNKEYLFSVNRVLLARSDKLFFIVGAVLIILAILLKVASIYAPNPIDKILRNKFYKLFLTIGVLEILWFGFRYENVPFFGSHFIALLILLIGLAWFIKLLISFIVNYKKDKLEWEKEQVKLRYLPK